MSKFNFNLVAVAIAAALAAPAAFATTVAVTGGVGPEVLPTNAFTSNAVIATNANRSLAVTVDGSSLYLGRTTPFNVRLTLSQGQFVTANPAPTLVGFQSATVIGGGIGTSSITYSVLPRATGAAAADSITFGTTQIAINTLGALASDGSRFEAAGRSATAGLRPELRRSASFCRA